MFGCGAGVDRPLRLANGSVNAESSYPDLDVIAARAWCIRSSKVPSGRGRVALSHLQDWSNLNGSVPVRASRVERGSVQRLARVRQEAISLERKGGHHGTPRASCVNAVWPVHGLDGGARYQGRNRDRPDCRRPSGWRCRGMGAWGFGVVLLAAGLLDFCVITGLIDNIWSGREVRARGSRGAPRTA
jgi:hypothetical protein